MAWLRIKSGRKTTHCPAFTLLELLATVAVLGVLVALLLSAVSRVTEAGKMGACVGNLRTIGSSVQIIVADENGTLPGTGMRTTNGSATWQDVLNLWAFESMGKDPLQRMGERREPGKMYCPAMKSWPQGGARYPRAYAMNTFIQNGPAETNAIYNGLYDYKPGRRMAEFGRPSQTILITESERSSDYISPSSPYDQIALGDGNTAPAWSSQNLHWAFRHSKKINVLFLDGHVESFSVEGAKMLNNPKSFNPGVQ